MIVLCRFLDGTVQKFSGTTSTRGDGTWVIKDSGSVFIPNNNLLWIKFGSE